MAKKSFLSVFALIFLISINLSAKKKDEYKKWLNEEVNTIITKAEKAAFKKLKKEKDKELFIKLFWAKRDPTPRTEKNEFKEEYYRRLNHVKKSYIYRYKKGISTDMGKVYLNFGKPKVLHPSSFDSSTAQQFPPEIWIYPTQPWMNIPKESFSFVFSHDGIGYVLDRSQTDNRVMQAFFSYPEKILLYPDLKDLPERQKLFTFSPESFEGKLIQQVKSTQENIIQIPFEKKTIFTKAENLGSYLTFLIKIDPGEEKETLQKKVVLFGRIESDASSYDFREEKVLINEKNYFISHVGLPLKSGEYRLFFGFSSQDNKTYSIKMEEITVPNFWDQEFSLSSLLASFQVKEEKALTKKGEFDVFSLGHYSLLPQFSQEYTKEEFLNIFYFIYNTALDENQNCSLLIELELQQGEKRFKMEPKKRQQKVKEGTALLEGTQIPLSALPESGEYELTVKVTDEIAKKTVSKKLKFSIH